MDTVFGRYAFQMLVLLACVIFTWVSEDQTPTREVVETVSVLYKPARVEPAAGGLATAQGTTSTPETRAELVVAPNQVQGEAPVIAQHEKAAPRPEPAPIRSTKPVTASSEVKQAVKKRPDARQARKAEPPQPPQPPLPAVFVPVRRLGLYLQARLGVETDEEVAQGNR